MNPFVILSAIILALFGSACSISPKAPATQSFLSGDYSPVIDYLKAYLPVQVNKHKFTGLSVALVDDQESGRTTVAATPLITQARMPVWDARVGEYTIQNPIDTDIGFFKLDSAALAYENGHYQFRVKNPFGIQSLPIAVVNETEAILQGYGRGLGETIIVEPDGTVLHLSLIHI